MVIHHRLLCVIVCALSAVILVRGHLSAQDALSTEVSLYFVGTEELKLAIEKRTIDHASNIVEQISLTIGELIKGPTQALMPTIPSETKLQQVFLDEKGCAYLDFSRAISQNHSGGTTGELVTISSIVNTLVKNFPEEIRKVRILIGGQEAGTLAGHIDISKPIFPFDLE